MKTLAITLIDETADKLEEAARKLGVSVDELLNMSIEEKLARLDEEFRSAAEYVLSKNAELYKRLA